MSISGMIFRRGWALICLCLILRLGALPGFLASIPAFVAWLAIYAWLAPDERDSGASG